MRFLLRGSAPRPLSLPSILSLQFNSPRSILEMSAISVDLPEECWELVFRFLGHHRRLESLSLVCKQFLSIANRLRFSLTIYDPTILVLPRLFLRFPRLRIIDLSHFRGDLDRVLFQISRSGLDLDSLCLSNQKTLPLDGLRALSNSKMKKLKALICSKMKFLQDTDLVVIGDCFPFLQELDISFPGNSVDFSLTSLNDPETFVRPVSDSGIITLSSVLRNLRKVNLSGNYLVTDKSLLSLCNNCESLKEITLSGCNFITQIGIAYTILHRPNLTSISFSVIGNRRILGIPSIDLDLIDSLLSLKSLAAIDLSNSCISDELLCSIAEEGLPLKKLILQSCCNYTYAGISCLLSRCQSVQYLDLQKAEFLTDQNVRELSIFLGNVISVNLSDTYKLTNSTFFTLTRNCPLLKEIKMERTHLGVQGLEDSVMDFVVNTQVESLHLAHNIRLGNESMKQFASVCPNLEMLDLRSCYCFSEEGVVEILKRCRKIRHLCLAFCAGLELFEIDFEVPKLEVLNLSGSRISDEGLSIISKRCCGLVHLELESCSNVTAKGVKQVVENCRALRKINLKCCRKVPANIVAWMVFARPSLRKIMAPPSLDLSDSQRKLLLRHGCLVF
ncbi:hypothetical protein L6164_021648 [Bauhinia variegata]|uniref:Uncharacterized protein n=1 Tax=Bauhinia variegata TaxID=167791 RepID=A0ACB9MYY6_BAUVA|nr:hypothetical protein L6164_021648 [Bauhinia variegata]